MKKSQFLWYLIHGMSIVIYLVIFFIFKKVDEAYSITHLFITLLSFIILLYKPILRSINGKLTELTYMSNSMGYLHVAIQVLLGLLTIKPLLNIVLSVVVFVVYVFVSLVLGFFNHRTNESQAVAQVEKQFVKYSATQVKLLISKVSDKSLVNELENLYDLLNTSPSKSHNQLKALEGQINNHIMNLKKVIETVDVDKAKSITVEIKEMINERNELLKSLQ